MNDSQPQIIDLSGEPLAPCSPTRAKPAKDWPPITITKEMMDEQIERLADNSRPANGRRQVMFVHPSAARPGRGLTPGVQVTLDVLKPGEETVPVRHNSTQINFCLQGTGSAVVNDRRIDFAQQDVWNHPSFVTYRHINDSKQLQARLTYSNAALLEMMRVHMVEEDPETGSDPIADTDTNTDSKAIEHLPTFSIGDDGAALMPYETLINPPSVSSPTLHWPWHTVKENLDKLDALGAAYVGRRLYLLFNRKTERYNGTTPNFFATFTIRPPGIVDKPHRHVSSSINYYFRGSGYSRVEGKRYDWKAGDLMVSAPGWAVHHHASDAGDPVYELTVQDQPLNIFMESLLWQEDLALPAKILGVDEGFSTNRSN
jgi:gentisate 1,2-dioxygenase